MSIAMPADGITPSRNRVMSREDRRVILASSIGTVFE